MTPEAMMIGLRAQWRGLMQHYEVDETLAADAFADLVARYQADGRYYHTLTHVRNMLRTVKSLGSLATDLPAIQLAVWFHDVVYDVHANNNEEQSARYAERTLQRLGLPEDDIANVARMIRATALDRKTPTDIDCRIMLDADLASFASTTELQLQYSQAIRQEFSFVPDDEYREKRRQILRRFLQRDRIYLTEPLYEKLEARARHNIQAQLARLAAVEE